uniref:Carbohydrate sulfotransferase n=1 Tax=Oryzias latipes TaxID=8090 RepID=A0A3P9J3K2_ORYLA
MRLYEEGGKLGTAGRLSPGGQTAVPQPPPQQRGQAHPAQGPHPRRRRHPRPGTPHRERGARKRRPPRSKPRPPPPNAGPRRALVRRNCAVGNQSLDNLNDSDLKNFIVDDKHGIIYCYIPKVACTNWKRILIALNYSEPYPDPMSFKHNWVHQFERFQHLNDFPKAERDVSLIINAKLKHYTKFLYVRDPFVRLISAYRDKMLNYDQYFYEGYVRLILLLYKKHTTVTYNHEVGRKEGLQPSFYNFIQYILDPRTEKKEPFEPHWRQMHRLCHPCLIEYDLVGHQESLQEDAQELLKILKLEKAIKFPSSYENMTSVDTVMDWFQTVPLEDRRKLYRLYEKDFKLFGYRRPTELLDD